MPMLYVIAAVNFQPLNSIIVARSSLLIYRCKQHRCKYCVKIDIESLYCKSCLEVVPPTEALSYNNHCTRCFECPCCYSILSIMLSSSNGKKQYYFSCQFCFWNSIEIGMVGLNSETLLGREKIDPLQLIVFFC